MKTLRLFLSLVVFLTNYGAYAEDRIGLFIASVDPITIAHAEVISAGIQELNLTKVIIMVNTSSDKDYSASVAERIDLVRLAMKQFAGQGVSFEIIPEPKEGKRAFAIQTAREKGGGVIYQIAGEDVQAKAKDLFAAAPEVKSYILPRLDPNETKELHHLKLLEGFLPLNSTAISATSSTEVKQKLERYEDVSHLLYPDVLSRILEKRLYSRLSDAEAVEKGKRLFLKMHEYIELIKSNYSWLNLTVPELANRTSFKLSSGVSTTDNLTFNRIQSDEASSELMTRIILKLNPGLDKDSVFNFRNWSHSVLNKVYRCESYF
jgi:nicotinic acid mononucleotide adenylyltransferase